MRPRDEVRRDFVRQWLTKAENDLETARHLAAARPDLCFAIAFHAQQAAEKLIKAALVWHQLEFPKTHDIDRFVALLRGADSVLAERLIDASSLTLYGVEARYPGDLPEPTVAEARMAVSVAERVREAVRASLPTSVHPRVDGE